MVLFHHGSEALLLLLLQLWGKLGVLDDAPGPEPFSVCAGKEHDECHLKRSRRMHIICRMYLRVVMFRALPGMGAVYWGSSMIGSPSGKVWCEMRPRRAMSRRRTSAMLSHSQWLRMLPQLS